MSEESGELGDVEIAYSEAAAGVPGLAAAVDRALAEAARGGPVERVVVHVHDVAGTRPRSPRALEGVVIASADARGTASTTVVRVSLDGDVLGVRSFSDPTREPGADGEPRALAAVAIAEEALGGAPAAGPWRSRPVGFVELYETPPPPNPERPAATVIADGRTGRLLYAATSGPGGRYLGP